MKLAGFSILTTLAVLFAVLTLAESAMYRTWDSATLQQRDIQNKVAHFQRLHAFLEQLVRRMAVDSLHDAPLAQLLKQHGIRVVQTGGEPLGAPPEATPTPSGGSTASPTPAPSATPAPGAPQTPISHP